GGCGGGVSVVVASAVWRWGGGGWQGKKKKRRVRESDMMGRIDRVTRSLFGFAGKIPPEKFSGGEWWWSAGWPAADNMANENVSTLAPIRSDYLILPFAAWFWDTLMFEAKTGAYRFQLDDDWFRLYTNLLREALEITPVDQAHQFMSPLSGDAIMDFVNQLSYQGKFTLCQEWRIAAEKEGGKKKTAPKVDKPVKPAPAKQVKPAMAKQPKPKPVKEKSTKPTPLQKAGKGKVIKSQTVKSSLQLVDEPDEEQDQPEAVPEPQGAGKEYDLKRAIQMSLESFQAQPQAHVSGVAIQEPDDTSANVVHDTPSPADAKTCADTDKVISEGDTEILNISKEQEDVDNKVYLEEQTAQLDKGHVGSDPSKTLESRPLPDDDKMDEDQARSDPRKSHVDLVGPNPEPMNDDFMATVYLIVHECLKFLADEQVILEDPLSSSGTLSSMKIMDDTYTFGDQFFNDKSTEDEPGK
nr:hypothetical protein [Tanacetum cinerariifolium]